MSRLLSKERVIAPPGFNRWRVPPASIAIHLCIGSVYAWSIFNPPLMKLRGVVASAADDWTLSQVTWIFTVAIVCLGLPAAVAGKWLERVGPRLVDPAAFERTFGAPLSQLAMLIEQKTITLPKLMALAPPGTVDPSSTLYSSTMLTMAGLLVIAFFANALIRPVDPQHHHSD